MVWIFLVWITSSFVQSNDKCVLCVGEPENSSSLYWYRGWTLWPGQHLKSNLPSISQPKKRTYAFALLCWLLAGWLLRQVDCLLPVEISFSSRLLIKSRVVREYCCFASYQCLPKKFNQDCFKFTCCAMRGRPKYSTHRSKKQDF